MAHPPSQTSINIPQLLAVALVGFLALRWYFNKPATATPSSTASRGQAVEISKVDQISAMFPQLDRRSIAWDLSRNGGNVAGTSERILSGRGLDTPPTSFAPNLPEPAGSASSTGATSQAERRGKDGQDLISRYGLQGRVQGKGKEPVLSEEQVRQGWSSDKAARAEGLRKRREEMVLAARRRMEEKVAEGGSV